MLNELIGPLTTGLLAGISFAGTFLALRKLFIVSRERKEDVNLKAFLFTMVIVTSAFGLVFLLMIAFP